ncbi:MAG: sodium:proton antiporter [Planctomycetota bacterium]
MKEGLITGLALVAIIGIGAQWLAWRLRLPSILLLMGAGFLAGPELLDLIRPDEKFGDLLLPIVSLSVAILLFEGGLTLRLRDIEGRKQVVGRLVTQGALVTWVLAALFAKLFCGMTWPAAILVGAILVVTGPTVIAPLLRQIRPTGPVGPILRWEGILIDPVGAVLAVLVLEFFVARATGGNFSALSALFKTIVLGGGVGIVLGWALTQLLARYWIPDHLHNAVSLAFALLAFTAGNAAQHEAGLLSVTLLGVYLANQERVDISHIVEFKENVQVLLIAALFILMSARLEFEDLANVGWGGVAFLIALILVVRPLSVWVCVRGSALERNERLFLMAMAPRGIVAAAVASVFALRLEAAGVPGGRELVPLVFFVILGTVATYGLLGGPVAYRLGLAKAKPQGVLLLGAHPWGRALGEALQNGGIQVLMVDTNPSNIRAARMAKLRTFQGSLLADSSDERVDLSGLGRLAALTPNDEVNTLSARHYQHTFGRAEIYQLPTEADVHGGRELFGMRYLEITQRFNEGARFRVTRLTAQFNVQAWREEHGEDAVPFAAIDGDGKLTLATLDQPLEVKAGSTLIGLVA